MSRKQMLLKVVLPIVILLLGVGMMRMMLSSRQAPAKQEQPFSGVLVETLPVARQDHPLQLTATGTVQARHESDIVPQVSGVVTKVGPNLVAGGFVNKGELLFAVEQIDFKLAVDRARANLTKAELELETMRAQAEIARSEWQQLHPDEEPSPLAVYGPQLKSAEAALASARATLEQAQLDLRRTRVVAPFNGYLRSETVDLGQYLRSGNKVATLVGTDAAEIIVPLPLSEQQWLTVPLRSGEPGSKATVSLPGSGSSWSGAVDRSLGEVDSQGRMARIAVLVRDPYGLKRKDGGLPLAVGSFVDVALQGATLQQTVLLPRLALREDDTVWVMDDEHKLRIQHVKVIRREQQNVFVSDGLMGGEQVVTSPISGAADGLLLRTADKSPKATGSK